MSSYIINGGKKLEGIVNISGSKNASLPIIAGAILNGKITKLYNVPNISDIQTTLQILKHIGCYVRINRNNIEINSANIKSYAIPYILMKKMRSSVIMAGALIGRFKSATFSCPGGCEIGARPIDLHLSGFKKLGINIREEAGLIICSCDKIKGGKIRLDFPSVGATENLILASVLAQGETVILNAAMEPEIIDLQNFLNQMGAKVEGAGTKVIKVTGVKDLKSVSYMVMTDRIEAGTFLCAAAVTGGNLELQNVMVDHITPIISKLKECGCKIYTDRNRLIINAPNRLTSTQIKTKPYPGFPTDMQSIFGATLCTANGVSIIVENIFENRYKYTNELIKMGARINVSGKTALITGVERLNGAEVCSQDLRGGAAIVIAGLAAKGITKINDIEFILRGYENFEKKLNRIGAEINIL